MDGRQRRYTRSAGINPSEAAIPLMRNATGLIISAHGITVPTDATAGYAPGCVFYKTDGTAGTVLYTNEGTSTSCAFKAVLTTSGGTQTITGAKTFATSVAVTTADTLTVGGIIVPQHLEISFHIPKIAADLIYNCFTARRAYTVTNVTYVPTILQGGALTITPVKATGTNAPAAATTPLTSAAFDGNTGLHTVQNGTLTATGADLALAAGDRIGLVLSTASTVHQGNVTFSLKRS